MPDRSNKLQSCLYAGTVWHRRFSPEHAFRYRLFLLYLDLSELDVVFHGRWLWSTRRAAVAKFRRDDHLGNPARPLDECVRDLVESGTGTRPAGPVRLLTQLRYFGYVMNPVSLYYCFDASGEAIEAVVAEVNNTPWGERHCYVIPWTPDRSADEATARHDKVFHVSPFLPMNMQYHWRLTAPGRQLRVEIENHRQGVREFAATLSLERRPITSASLAAVLLRHPFMTGRIAAAIYWQALRLWWQGARFYPHPAQPDRKLSLSKSESFTAGVRNPT